MLKFKVHYSGCNCDCTASEDFYVEGEDISLIKKAIANIYFDHRSYASNPYYKLSISSENQVEHLEKEIIEIASRIKDYEEEIIQLKSIIKKPNNYLKSIKYHSKELEISIPQNCLDKFKIYETESNEAKKRLDMVVKEANEFTKVPDSTRIYNYENDELENYEYGIFNNSSSVDLDE